MMTSDPMTKLLRYRWLIFVLLTFGYLMVYFHRLCPAVLAVDLMRDLNASGSLTGLLGAAYFYPYALMQIPAGLLSDSWGPRNTITLFFIIAFAGCLILGLAPSVFWAIIGRTIVGVGVAMLFVPTLKILAEWFRIREFAYMIGILMAMGGVGSLVAATPLVWLSDWIGWRYSFVLVGVFTLFLAILVWLFVRNRPSDMGWPPLVEPGQTEVTSIGLVQSIKQVLANRHFWPLAIWFFFDFAVFFSFGGLWGGPYLMHVYGMSKAQSGHVLSILALGMVVGGPLLSWLSDKVFQGRKPVLLLCSAMVLAMTALLAFQTDGIPKWGLSPLFFLMSVCVSASGVIGFTMNKELFPVKIAGTATGLANLFPFIGGAVFQPLLGYILERFGKVGDAFTLDGYRAAFLALFIASILALAAAAMTRETLQRDRT